MAELPSTLPARIMLQIRDGVPNTLLEFDIPVDYNATEQVTDENRGNASVDATLRHEVLLADMISGLIQAQRALIVRLREVGPEQGLTPPLIRAIERQLYRECTRAFEPSNR